MQQQVFIDSRYADHSLPDGSHAFWLRDPIHLPPGSRFRARVLNAWVPLTYYTVHEDNDRLELNGELSLLPHGNRSVDELLDAVTPPAGWVASYDPATNRVRLECSDPAASLEVGARTTCAGLLGLAAGQAASQGALVGAGGVDLTRTSSIFVRSNLYSSNRDPITKRAGDILCKIPVSHENANEIVHYSQPADVFVYNQVLTHLVIGLYDDDMRALDLNGLHYTMTLHFSAEQANESYTPRARVFEGESAGEAAGGPDRRSDGDSGASAGDRGGSGRGGGAKQ